MTTPSGDPTDHEYWRRPADLEPGQPAPRPAAPAAPETPGYQGPPPTTPATTGWRPPTVVNPMAPRQLPSQDQDSIDADERGARTLTYGIAMVGGAVLVIVICLLCSRVLF
ncbi:translation initiation factor 2 [Polymorphospora lycopeni]|uniref:Translation initiation factor 2 n=1 Tax=Polymorphospora lycopeni TaxID=3140240 RepID=A0ABV5CTN3_9ACTN